MLARKFVLNWAVVTVVVVLICDPAVIMLIPIKPDALREMLTFRLVDP